MTTTGHPHRRGILHFRGARETPAAHASHPTRFPLLPGWLRTSPWSRRLALVVPIVAIVGARYRLEAKSLAARTRRSLNAVIEDALREMLARREPSARTAVWLTTLRANGLRPGVDLDDSAALYDLMDADAAS